MSFIGDYFNHQKRVERRFEQLDILNAAIKERKNSVYEADRELSELETRISEIRSKYPKLSEEEAMIKYFETLSQQNSELESAISLKKEELNGLLAKLNMALELDKIAMEKEKLEQELVSLKQHKNSLIKVEDILFVGYFLSDSQTIGFSAFSYFQKQIYKDTYNKRKFWGHVYKSLVGNRIIGFTRTYDSCLITDVEDDDDEVIINTIPKIWISFTDACIAVKSDIYLKGSVSINEINEVLQQFISSNEFVEDDNIVKIRGK